MLPQALALLGLIRHSAKLSNYPACAFLTLALTATAFGAGSEKLLSCPKKQY